MALFDNWKQNRLLKKIEKSGKHIGSKSSSRDNRVQAIEVLKEISQPEAIEAMLNRFRLTAPELTQDEEEKDYVAELIAKRGQAARPALEYYINHYDEVVRPISLLAKLLPPDELIAFLMQAAADVGELYSGHKTIKLVEILRYLSRFESPELVEFAATYLFPHHDDEVVIAAIDILQKQADERALDPLLELLANPDTTQRIMYRLGELFASLTWGIKGLADRKQIENRLKPEYYIVRGGFVKRKG